MHLACLSAFIIGSDQGYNWVTKAAEESQAGGSWNIKETNGLAHDRVYAAWVTGVVVIVHIRRDVLVRTGLMSASRQRA